MVKERSEQQPEDSNPVTTHAPVIRPAVTGTAHVLPFDRLSPRDFERLCLALLPHEDFDNPEHYGATGSERGRDIVAYRKGKLWYVQCKRVKECGPQLLLDEVEKIRGLMRQDASLRPAGMLFIASCDVSATARDRVRKQCDKLGLACEIWGGTDLDARVHRRPEILATFFGQQILSAAIPFQVPPLPSYFVPRPEASDVLKDRLLSEEAIPSGALVVCAIHGLGGIGKSTLAAALARDPAIATRFPDGTMWVTLGQQPDLLSLQSTWIQALGDYNYKPTTIEAATLHLRTLLKGKAALLVIDDAWRAEQVRPLMVGDTGCRVLITTRRASVADEVGATLFDLDVMRPEQSLALLEARLARAMGGMERDHALQLAAAVGHLPLALELAAARVARGATWIELRQALEEEVARLEALEDPRHRQAGHARLEASLNLSLQALRTEYEKAWAAFVWLGVLPEDVSIAAPMAATLWNVKEAEASTLLEWLWNDALLLSGTPTHVGERNWPTYRIHDLLHDLARRIFISPQPEGLGILLAQGHEQLLARYRQQLIAGQWHTLPIDGYIESHLVWHLGQAGRHDEIHALLHEETIDGKNGWYEARERLGQTAGYLEDVHSAWRIAEELADSKSPTSLGFQCYYALITASLNSLAKSIPPALLEALIKNQVWTQAEGLAYAQRVPDPIQRVEALGRLIPYLLSEVLKDEALRGALAAARGIRDGDDQARALARLRPYLSEQSQGQIPGDALLASPPSVSSDGPVSRYATSQEAGGASQEGAQEMPPGDDPARELVGLALRLPEALRGEALRGALLVARETQDEDVRAQTLAGLAPHLPEPLLQQALEVAREIKRERSRARALAGLATHLAEPLKTQTLQEALAVACEIRNWDARARALAELAPHMPEVLLRELLAAAVDIEDKHAQVRALLELAPYLSEALLRETLAITREIDDSDAQATVLVGLAPHLTEVLLREALAATRDIGNWESRSHALTGLAPHLPNVLLREALQSAQSIGDKDAREEALAGLAPYLPSSLLPEALQASRRIHYWEARARTLVGLAPHLPEALLGNLLEAAQETKDEYARALALTGSVPYLSPSLREKAVRDGLAAVRQIEWEGSRAEALAGLVPYLPEALLKEAMGIARVIQYGDDRTRVLASLAPRLSESLLREALAAASEMRDEDARARAVIGLGPHLPENLLQEALTTVRDIRDEGGRARALVGLAPYLAEPLRDEVLQEALSVVRKIENEDILARTLAEMIACLPEACENVLHEGLELAYRIKDQNTRTQTLAELAQHLSKEQLQEVLTAVRLIESEEARAEPLVRLAPYLPSAMLPEALAIVQEIQDGKARARALEAMAPHLPETLLPEALTVARETLDEDARMGALVGLAPHLLEAQLAGALEAICEIEDEYSRAQGLAGLAPHLPEPSRREALRKAVGAATEIRYMDDRAQALRALVPYLTQLPRSILYPLWCETLSKLAQRTRQDILSDLQVVASLITELGSKEAVAETFRAIQNTGRWWP
jgi:hypothetical protein